MSFCFVLVFVFVLFLVSVYPYNEPNSILCFKFWIDASNSNIFLSSAADFASTPVAANKLTIVVDHHFNWFQKKMIKWCFGFNVENYTEQTEEELI